MKTQQQIRQTSNTVHNKVDQAASAAKQQVRQVAPEYAPEASQAIDDIKSQAHQVTQEVRQQATELVDTMQQQASTMVSSRMDEATNTVSSVATALRQSGEQLQADNQGFMASYVHQAADQLDGVSNYLRESDPTNLNGIISDVEDFARREPALFLGGAMVAGLFLARFLKSSTPQQSRAKPRRTKMPLARRYPYETRQPIQRYQGPPSRGFEKRVNR